jgi:glycosyltransferase involved in cell wall biosynthesis
MKILQFINSMYTAGAEVLVCETTRRYIERGHSVDIFLLNSKRTELYRELESMKNVRLLGFKEGNNIYSPLNIFGISNIIGKRSYDIVHVHLFPSFYWAALAKSAFKKAKLVYTEHNTNNRRMGNALYRWIDNHIYPFYDCHIAISDTVRDKMEAHVAVPRNKIVTLYNGINLAEIEHAKPVEKRSLNLPDNSKIILQVSAFRPQKDQETLLRALKQLDDNVNLLLAGEGETKPFNMDLAKKLGISDRVHFLGVRNDVPRLLKTADIVVLSSHYEGLSLSSVEGLASGKPFLASDVPGLTEVVQGAGVLFPQGDQDRLAKEIRSLLEDETRYETVARACRERSKKYDIERMVDNYLNLYDELLSTRELH